MTGAAAARKTDLVDALEAEERALIRRHPLPAPIFLPTDRQPLADRVAGLRRVLALYEGRWAAEHRSRLAALRDRHKGRRIFILGNGPSLGRVDLDTLAGEITVGVNGLFLAFPETRFRPTYHVVEDHLVAEDRAAEINALPPGITRLFPINLAYVLDEGPGVVWFDHRPRPGYPDRFDVSLDALAVTYAGCTVAFTCLQLAVFLGAREIVLLGIDLDYRLPADVTRQKPHGGGVGVLDMASDDPNHFHPDYFGKGKRWHDPQVDNMGRAFASARDVLGAMGVRLINATPGGRLDLVPRRPLAAVLAGESAPPPRLLVLDLTPVGGLSASGQMKAALMAPWRGGRLMAVCPEAAPDRFVVHHPDGRVEADVDAGTAAARARAFAPEAVYYRPQPSRGHLHPLALDLIHHGRWPLILHLLDDWPALLARTDPLAHGVWDQDLRWLARRAGVRLGIGDSMASTLSDRYGGGTWQALANGIDPTDWPDRDSPAGAGCPTRSFDLVYAGSLSATMNRDAVAAVARAVDALNRSPDGPRMALTLWVLPPWTKAARDLAEGLSGVAVSIADDPDPAAYRARLRRADGVLLAVGFEPDSRRHTRHSIANTLPEALASGAAILAHGPEEQATLATLAAAGDVAMLVTEPDPAALGTALARLAGDPALAARLGARGRAYALNAFALAPRQRRLEALVRTAAAERSVISADHSRADGARLDESALLLALARFQTTAPGRLVDVGAHRGGFLAPFAEAGWSVLALEPEAANHAALAGRAAAWPLVTVERLALSDAPAEGAALFTAPDSTGVAALSPFLDSHRETDRVRVDTLTDVLDRHGLDTVDVLKVDTEGWDLRVLLGLDWGRWRPRLVMVEFENAKTLRLGHSMGDLVALLEGRGYVVWVSEWHPVLRYGSRHDWRRLTGWPPGDDEPLHDPDGWGNLIALDPEAGLPNDDALAAMARAALTVAPRDAPEPATPPRPAARPAPSAPDPAPPPAPPPPAPPRDSRLARGLRLARAMLAMLSGWRAPVALGLLALAAALPWLPAPGSSLGLLLLTAGLLALAAYAPVRALRLAAEAEDIRKHALEARFKRHIGWVRGDMAALGDDLAARLRTLDADAAALRAALGEEHSARVAAATAQETALTRRLDDTAATLDRTATDLAETTRRLALADTRVAAHGQALDRLSADLATRADTLADRLARDTRGLAETVAELRADLSRENAARDAAWQAAVDDAERTAARADRALSATLTQRLAEDRQRAAASLAHLRGGLGEPPPGHRLDTLEDRLIRAGALGADRFQPFARALTDADMDRLRTRWPPTLGLPALDPRALGHLADRLLALERQGGGRLACSLPAALLRALAARAAPGADTLRALEVGVLFGLGLGVLAVAIEDQPGRRPRLLGIDPLDGGAYGAPDDPVTGARVTPARVRRILARLGLPRRAVTLIRRSSADPLAVARARRWAGPAGLGLLILDGRHDHAGLTADWTHYAPLLRPGGLALIDDHGAAAWPDVAPFVAHVAARTPGVTLLGDDWGTAVLRRDAIR
ncbi:FkbM family methyltransferase [Roseospira visakhapatnamensis]|uniref:FkbM family methyltransferase n=1 Tax=Roseospira visakhapatnamensis TaxID=390880 RepID=A0A7W6WA28_9PROT|nr:FkbM family methyltransferase [Roseospira visakhapatnamensis]MBB4266433.1 FkbM family methyltransferase [Roseospira visakhapatnamensis]